MPYDTSVIIQAFTETADAIGITVSGGLSWAKSGGHKGQHQGDIDADNVGIGILTGYGFRIFSEESGFTLPSTHTPSTEVVAVIDPVDGSTNASKGIPFYAVSLCAIVDGAPLVGFVRNLASGDTYLGEVGKGSTKNGNFISASNVTEISKSVIGLNGYSAKHLGWGQCRAFGSAALELCMVAEGALDGYADLSDASLASWDILGGVLICQEAGATVICQDGNDYVPTDLEMRKRIVAAGTVELAQELQRRAWS
ncbi:MAG: inositol monophosphatase [Actinomycetota bacterium]|nr:inositol monophosphatase [Actinomycetota bacterium]